MTWEINKKTPPVSSTLFPVFYSMGKWDGGMPGTPFSLFIANTFLVFLISWSIDFFKSCGIVTKVDKCFSRKFWMFLSPQVPPPHHGGRDPHRGLPAAHLRPPCAHLPTEGQGAAQPARGATSLPPSTLVAVTPQNRNRFADVLCIQHPCGCEMGRTKRRRRIQE